MGMIVGGFATAHILMKRGSGGEAGERVFAGIKRLGEMARGLRPNLMIVISSEHYYNASTESKARISVVSDAVLVPFGDLGLPRDPFPGAPRLAADLVLASESVGIDLQSACDYRPDHGVVLPARIIDPSRTIPVLPIIVNTGLATPPSTAQCFSLGELIRSVVSTALPAAERVIVVGTGGLSHWLGVPDMGKTNPEFDARVLAAFEAGDAARLTQWSLADVESEGGNGGLEVLCWMVMAGAVPGVRAERVYYENVEPWISGMGGIAAIPSESVRQNP